MLLRPGDSEACENEYCNVIVLVVYNNAKVSTQAHEEAVTECGKSYLAIVVWMGRNLKGKIPGGSLDQ